MPCWTESPACQSRAHCAACRDPSDAGRSFRASSARHGKPIPEVCPFGVDGVVEASEAVEVTVKGEPARPTAIPQSEWPWFACLLANRRNDADTGLGDTVSRLLGGDATKRILSRLMGRDCGCGDRQAKMNALYPYLPTISPA